MSYITTHIQPTEAYVLNTYFKRFALRVFLMGLNEPLSSLMKTKNPNDLNEALNILTNHGSLYNKVGRS